MVRVSLDTLSPCCTAWPDQWYFQTNFELRTVLGLCSGGWYVWTRTARGSQLQHYPVCLLGKCPDNAWVSSCINRDHLCWVLPHELVICFSIKVQMQLQLFNSRAVIGHSLLLTMYVSYPSNFKLLTFVQEYNSMMQWTVHAHSLWTHSAGLFSAVMNMTHADNRHKSEWVPLGRLWILFCEYCPSARICKWLQTGQQWIEWLRYAVQVWEGQASWVQARVLNLSWGRRYVGQPEGLIFRCRPTRRLDLQM